MIKEIDSFGQYENFIRSISKDLSFADPHFLYDENNLYGSLKKKNMKAFVVNDDFGVHGLFVWLILEEERYIELIIGLSNHKPSLEDMLTLMEEKYPGYQRDFVINPRHVVFREILENRNAYFGKSQIQMVFKNEANFSASHRVMPLTPEYENAYRAVHDDSVYWTAERILRARDRFRVFIATNRQKIVGYLDITRNHRVNEPYSLWVDKRYKSMEYEKDLLLTAIEFNKPAGMMALIDADNDEEIKLYQSAGFVSVEGHESLYATYTK